MMRDEFAKQYMNVKASGVKPADFDAFWKRGVEEAEDIPIDYRLEKVDIPSTIVDCYILLNESMHKSYGR